MKSGQVVIGKESMEKFNKIINNFKDNSVKNFSSKYISRVWCAVFQQNFSLLLVFNQETLRGAMIVE